MSNPGAGGSDINNVEEQVRISPHEPSTELDGLFWVSAAQDTLEKVSGIRDVLKPSWRLFLVLGFFAGEGGKEVIFNYNSQWAKESLFSFLMDAA